MGDRVAVLKDGILQQADTPLNLYDKPANLFVAGFIGSPAMNLLRGAQRRRPRQARRRPGPGRPRAPRARAAATSPSACVPRRGGSSARARAGSGEGHRGRGARRGRLRLRHQRRRGHARPGDRPHRRAARHDHKGDTIYVTTDPQNVHVFDTESGERLTD